MSEESVTGEEAHDGTGVGVSPTDRAVERLGCLQRWWGFARERFDPVSHLLMIVLFVLAHVTAVAVFSAPRETSAACDVRMAGVSSPPARGVHSGTCPDGLSARDVSNWKTLLLVLGTGAFFFKLRLYDEIKDYELDCRINRDRPLVRGLVTHDDLFNGIGCCIGLEMLVFAVLSPWGLAAIVPAIAYSLLMYKEFFIGRYIRPHLTTYAVMHTVVCSFLSVAMFSALANRPPWMLDRDYIAFSAACWFLFNIFEFGRKTFETGEERENVDSYSRIFGRYGAVALVAVQALATGLAMGSTRLGEGPYVTGMIAAVSVLVTSCGLLYAAFDRKPWGRIYRGMSSAYIVLVLGGLTMMGLAGLI